MRITFTKLADANASLLYKAGRIAFHFMVGAFLAFIPVSAVILQKLFIFQYRSTVLLALWFISASLYTYVQIRRELTLTVVAVPAPNLWKEFLLKQAFSSFLIGAFVGGVIISMMIGGHVLAFSIAGGIAMLLFFAFSHKLYVEKEQQLLNHSKYAIVQWVKAGTTEQERSRRISYAKSGALYLGAGVVGVAEDFTAPKLIWPEIPAVSRLQFFRPNSEATVINPSSGLPMTGNSVTGFDGAGNAYGNSNKLFDD